MRGASNEHKRGTSGSSPDKPCYSPSKVSQGSKVWNKEKSASEGYGLPNNICWSKVPFGWANISSCEANSSYGEQLRSKVPFDWRGKTYFMEETFVRVSNRILVWQRTFHQNYKGEC